MSVFNLVIWFCLANLSNIKDKVLWGEKKNIYCIYCIVYYCKVSDKQLKPKGLEGMGQVIPILSQNSMQKRPKFHLKNLYLRSSGSLTL